jgi:hypothetical protein
LSSKLVLLIHSDDRCHVLAMNIKINSWLTAAVSEVKRRGST